VVRENQYLGPPGRGIEPHEIGRQLGILDCNLCPSVATAARDHRVIDLREAIEVWDRREHEVEPEALQAYATRFSETQFHAKMRGVLGLVANL